MDISRLLPPGGAIKVDRFVKADHERNAIAAVALWASDCLGHTEQQAAAYQLKILSLFDGGRAADRIVDDMAAQVERAGKPSLASFASIVFTQTMEHSIPRPQPTARPVRAI